MQNLNEQQNKQKSVDSLKPIAKLHAEIGMDSMAEKMYALGLVQPNMHDDFVSIGKIDIKKI
jgi:hypothetical protein